MVQRLRRKHVVLKESKKTQVGNHAGHDCQPLLDPRGSRSGDDFAPDKIYYRREHHQADEPRLPPAVENIAGTGNPEVPPTERQVKIDQQKHRQEIEDENVGGEDHVVSLVGCPIRPQGEKPVGGGREAVVQCSAGRQVLQIVIQRQAVDFTRHKLVQLAA